MIHTDISDLSFRYPGEERYTLSHISMEIEAGTFNVICGKSGCGKTTLLRHLKPVLAPSGERTGTVRYMGRDITGLSLREQSEEIGYVLQSPEEQTVTDKVWHELAFGLESLGYGTAEIRRRTAEAASYFGIQDWFERKVTELSGGQKQMLALASVMVMHPGLLILDEPTAQLDPIAASEFLETVRRINRELGTTVIIADHRLEDIIPWADKVFVMDKGMIHISGSPGETGKALRNAGDDMFLAMPAPMQIYAGTESKQECPLTVSGGRRWLERELEGRTPLKGIARKHESIKKEPVISMKDVWFRYDRDMPDVVRGLSMEIYRGEIFALVGGNGTGKTTAMKIISRMLSPYKGRIRISGRDIRKYTDDELYHGMLGVMPQDPKSMFVKKTVREDLYEIIDGMKEKKSPAWSIPMSKKDGVEGIAALTGLEGLLDRHPYDLSGGEQQRLALAKVLLLRPRILLMDEPTKGMDGCLKRDFGELLHKLCDHGVTVFIVSHDIEFCAAYADRAGLFFRGDMVSCGPAREFFAGNDYYTTAANRMARNILPDAVTAEDVISAVNGAGKGESDG